MSRRRSRSRMRRSKSRGDRIFTVRRKTRSRKNKRSSRGISRRRRGGALHLGVLQELENLLLLGGLHHGGDVEAHPVGHVGGGCGGAGGAGGGAGGVVRRG